MGQLYPLLFNMHWSKALPMDRAETMCLQSCLVGSRAVAFVFSKSITRVFFIHLNYHAVAGNLGDNGSAGDRKTQAITIYNTFLRIVAFFEPDVIYKQILWLRGKLFHGSNHGQAGGFGNADHVYFIIIRRCNPQRVSPCSKT